MKSKISFEMSILTSEDKLNALATRGDDEIVDWQPVSMNWRKLQ